MTEISYEMPNACDPSSLKKKPVREHDLILRCARGDESAFRELVGRVEKPLINFIYRYVGERHEAEDIFQETFVRVLRALGTFRPQASVKTWVFTIARNLCLDRLKTRKRHREVSLEASQSDPRGNVIFFKDVLQGKAESDRIESEDEQRLRSAIRELPSRKREALVMRLYSGLSYEEIARIVRAPEGTVKFRVHEALRELGKKLAAPGSAAAAL